MNWREFHALREYFSPCRLQASLTRSAVKMRTRFCALHIFKFYRFFCAKRVRLCSNEKSPATGNDGNFAVGEYIRALRLVSKLPDLRAGYANPRLCA